VLGKSKDAPVLSQVPRLEDSSLLN